jgi:hypothetical protein
MILKDKRFDKHELFEILRADFSIGKAKLQFYLKMLSLGLMMKKQKSI